MTITQLKNELSDGVQDVLFDYNDARGGISCTVDDGKVTYTLYYGDYCEDYSDLDEAVKKPIFNGKSLSTFCPELDLEFV